MKSQQHDMDDNSRSIRLSRSAELEHRIEVATLLFQKAEAKVTHADTYRQRNMNYSLVIFAGMIALGVRLPNYTSQAIVSGTLLVFMVIFCVWDRRWHRIKHGWQSTGTAAYRVLSNLINNKEADQDLVLYVAKGEKKAELFSWQPMIFYLLIAGALATFLLFWHTNGSQLETTSWLRDVGGRSRLQVAMNLPNDSQAFAP